MHNTYNKRQKPYNLSILHTPQLLPPHYRILRPPPPHTPRSTLPHGIGRFWIPRQTREIAQGRPPSTEAVPRGPKILKPPYMMTPRYATDFPSTLPLTSCWNLRCHVQQPAQERLKDMRDVLACGKQQAEHRGNAGAECGKPKLQPAINGRPGNDAGGPKSRPRVSGLLETKLPSPTRIGSIITSPPPPPPPPPPVRTRTLSDRRISCNRPGRPPDRTGRSTRGHALWLSDVLASCCLVQTRSGSISSALAKASCAFGTCW